MMLSIHHGIAGASSVLQRCRLVASAQPVLTIVMQARAERQDGGSYGHQ